MIDRRTQDGWLAQRDALRVKACNGNLDAALFLASLMDAVEIWDDLIDQDKPVGAADINRVFINLLFWLPQNKFFEANKTYILPIVMTCINAWMDSDALAKTKEEKKLHAAWWLKQMGVELYGSIAFLTGGFEHMRAVSLEAREVLAHEDFADYLKENNHA